MRAALACAAAAAAPAAAAPPRVLLHPPSTVPPWWEATGEAVDATRSVDVLATLRRRDAAAIDDAALAASTPGGAGFLRHLSHGDAGRLVRPPAAALRLVAGWLRSGGAGPARVHAHGDSIAARLTVGGVQALLGAPFLSYRHRATGEVVARVTGGVRVPADVAGALDTLSGFHGFPLPPRRAAAPGAGAPRGNVTPALINRVHNIPLVPKSGARNVQAVAQFQGEYFSASSLAAFCERHAPDPAGCRVAKFIGDPNDLPSKPGKGECTETMLDTEYITSLAQGTETWLYSFNGKDFCSDLLQFASAATNESSFPYVISISYGSQLKGMCDAATTKRLSQDIQKMAAMGITVVIASGDDGNGYPVRAWKQKQPFETLSPSFPASVPYAVAVGSTYFVDGASGEQQATARFASGGGFSFDYARPAYQSAAVSAYLNATQPAPGWSWARGGRGTPDVAMLGDNFVITTPTKNGARDMLVGGTSASAPSFAAVVTLLNEVCLAAAGRTLGAALPLLYRSAAAFVDVTKGTNSQGALFPGYPHAGESGVWAARRGWDAATGLGYPDFAALRPIVADACRGAAA